MQVGAMWEEEDAKAHTLFTDAKTLRKGEGGTVSC